MNDKVQVEYLADISVDAELDQDLRNLLSSCFKKPQDHVFKDRRYFKDPYQHRWVIKNEVGALVAHVGVHNKIVEAGEYRYKIGGIAEVCVLPEYRGHGYVRSILNDIHQWMEENKLDFAMLFGKTDIYSSSGYVATNNLTGTDATTGKRISMHSMIRPISTKTWPTDIDVHLIGNKF